MKTWQFYTLTVIGICLIALTGAISYTLRTIADDHKKICTQINDTKKVVLKLTEEGKMEKEYEYSFRALLKSEFYGGEYGKQLPNDKDNIDLYGYEYVGTLFEDRTWVFILERRPKLSW